MIGSRPTPGTRASSRACSPGGLLEPIYVPCAGAGGGPRSGARPRGRAPRSDARPASTLEVLPAARAEAALGILGCRSPQVALRAALLLRRRAADLRHLPARARPRRPPDRGARARDRETAEQDRGASSWPGLRCLRGIDTLSALGIVVEIGDFDRFNTAEEFMAFVGWCPRSTPPASGAGRARSPRSVTRTCAACSSSRPGTRADARRSATSSPAASAARTPSSSSAPGAASSASTRAGSGWPPAASLPEDRRRLRPRARRLRLGDRDRATAQERLSDEVRAADAPDHTEDPRSLYAAPASAGDPRR